MTRPSKPKPPAKRPRAPDTRGGDRHARPGLLLRATDEQWQAWEAAAERVGETLSGFIRGAADARARFRR